MTRYLLASTPKAGTALAMRILEDLLGERMVPVSRADVEAAGGDLGRLFDTKGGRLLVGHIRRGQIDWIPADVRVIALVRDPRDVVLSYLDYLFRDWAGAAHRSAAERLRPLEARERQLAMIDGFRTDNFIIPDIVKHCSGFAEWTEAGGVLVRYEELIGPDAEDAVRRMLGPDAPPDDTVRKLLGRIVGKPAHQNFNVGGAGRWRKAMDRDVACRLERKAWALMAELGYACEIYDPEFSPTPDGGAIAPG